MEYQLVRSNSLTSEHEVLGTYNALKEVREHWPNYWYGWDIAMQDLPEPEWDDWDVYVVGIDTNGNRTELGDIRAFEEDI